MEQYERLLAQFPTDPHFTDMREAVQRRDWQAAFSAAHALKGIAGNLSMKRLYADLAPLVEELRAGRVERAEAMLEPVCEDYAEILSALGAAL